MKKIFFSKALLLSVVVAGAQNVVFTPKESISTSSKEDRWNLDKYVWSHTHFKMRKTDKPVIDFDLIDNWTVSEKDISITNDGKYFAYATRYTRNKQFRSDSLIIMSTKSLWRLSFPNAKAGFFSGDGNQYVVKNEDKLYFVKTGTDHLKIVDRVINYKIPNSDKANWVAYQLDDKRLRLTNLLTGKEYSFNAMSDYKFEGKSKWLICRPVNNSQELICFNLDNGIERRFLSVMDFRLDNDGETVLLKKASENGGARLEYIRLKHGSKRIVWSSTDPSVILQGYNLDSKGVQIAFTLKREIAGSFKTSLWYWNPAMTKPIEKISGDLTRLKGCLISGEAPSFTENGRYVKFTIEENPENFIPLPDAVQLNVWSYFDTVLQSTQLVETNAKQRFEYKSFIAVDGEQIIRETKDEKLKSESVDFIILSKSGNSVNGDRFWEKGYYLDSNWLVSLKDGFRRFLQVTKRSNSFWFSPDGKCLVCFNEEHQCYFSYNLQTSGVANISIGVPKNELVDSSFKIGLPVEENLGKPFGTACWREKTGEMWVYGRYDIWSLDLKGKRPALNITNMYGKNHHIIFRLSGAWGNLISTPSFIGADVLLKAQNEESKYNGFYRLVRSTLTDPQLLYMGPCVLEEASAPYEGDMIPLKAADANTWIVKMQGVTEAPDYFLTKDFKTYRALTNLQPQKKYNWLTAELHSFKQLDGSIGKGILYKPENFDSSKKYPVIVAFYTSESDGLYIFPQPEYIRSPDSPTDNPGWFVSRGYLVFLPDIDFTKGKWGPCTVNSVEGAAKYLAQLPFVDGNRIGAAGHSNSGRFGYYLLTHTQSFKAMCVGSGSGGTDLLHVSLSLEKEGNQESMLEWAENGSVGKGLGNLWENKDRWIDHMAVIQADKVTTPLLLFHNKLDGDDVQLAVELLIAMRRLDKKIWWLEYDEEGHVQGKHLKDRRDFTIRYTQYFDHYLKEAPAPVWMTRGISANLKGVITGYELDPSGTCSKGGQTCSICDAWNKQYKRNPAMFAKPISEWKLDDDIQKELDKEETERYRENVKGEEQRIKQNNEKLKGTWRGQPY